jgi:hypothetical protein
MRKLKPSIIFFSLCGVLLLSTCQEIDESWLDPEWITDKIAILGDDCYYKGSTIKKYLIDTTYYIDIYIPSSLWPVENVFFEDGSQVIDKYPQFTYYYFESARGDAIETIWSFPTSKSCP